MKNNVKQIGEIGVDAGLCWIGDPCYILHRINDRTPKAISKDWGEFCKILDEDGQYPTAKQFNYDLGHPGLGVVVSTGYGDGVYPVFAEYGDEGRIAKVWVEFMEEEGDEADLLAFIARIARLTKDGEAIDGKEFVMENDDAVDTLHDLIDAARHLVARVEGRPA